MVRKIVVWPHKSCLQFFMTIIGHIYWDLLSDPSHHIFTTVNELVQKYGQGEVTTEKCNICGFEQEKHSSGVHETEGGSLKVYAADDALICTNCNRDEPAGTVRTTWFGILGSQN